VSLVSNFYQKRVIIKQIPGGIKMGTKEHLDLDILSEEAKKEMIN